MQIVKYIGETIPAESPVMFGLHPNAEIGFRLAQADGLFKSVLSLQQRSVDGGAAASVQVRPRGCCCRLSGRDNILSRLTCKLA